MDIRRDDQLESIIDDFLQPDQLGFYTTMSEVAPLIPLPDQMDIHHIQVNNAPEIENSESNRHPSRPSNKDWDIVKESFRELYISRGLTLAETMAEIAQTGFRATYVLPLLYPRCPLRSLF